MMPTRLRLVLALLILSALIPSSASPLIVHPSPFQPLPAYTLSGLPAAGTAGRLADVTDSIGGIHKDTGLQWIQIHGDKVNIKDRPFGARCDGTTDDTIAVQAALTVLQTNGGMLIHPGGDCKINLSRLTYVSTKPIAIVGNGWQSKFTWNPATDVPVNNKGMLNITGTGDLDANHTQFVLIADLFFDFGGSRAAGYDINKRGINIWNADNIYILRNHFKGARGEMVGFGNFGGGATPGQRAVVQFNRFFDFAQDGVNPNAPHADVSHNLFVQGDAPIEAGGDYFTAIGNTAIDMNGGIGLASIKQFVIKGNRLLNCRKDGVLGGCIQIAGAGQSSPSLDGIIEGNTITVDTELTSPVGIYFTRGTSTSDHARISVQNNTVRGMRKGIGINSLLDGNISGNTLIGGSGVGAGLTLDTATIVARNSVHGNTIRNFAARSVGFTTNGPIQDGTAEVDANVVGWNTQENALVLGVTGRIQFADGDTTPSVRRPALVYIAGNSAPTTITQFDDGTIGQEITVIVDANTTIQNNVNILLAGAVNFVGTANDTITLVGQTATLWVEKSRSVN